MFAKKLRMHVYSIKTIRLAKIRLHVLLSGDVKGQLKFQHYLVHINFFNKEMFSHCNIEEHFGA